MGYWVRSSQTRRGIGTQAVNLLIDWAFHAQSLHRLELCISIKNHPSQRLAVKVGATREAILRERMLLHNEWHDCALYSLINAHDGRQTSGSLDT